MSHVREVSRWLPVVGKYAVTAGAAALHLPSTCKANLMNTIPLMHNWLLGAPMVCNANLHAWAVCYERCNNLLNRALLRNIFCAAQSG